MAKSLKDFPPAAQVGLLAVAAFAVVAVPFYFFVYPLVDQRTDLQKKVSALAAENKSNQAFETKQTEYKIKINQLENQLQTLRSMVPDTVQTDEFMKAIFKAGSESGIHVRTFLPQPTVPKEDYVEAPYRVRLDGTYWELVNYFDRLSKEQRIISVTNISLGAPAGGGMGAYEISSNESVGADCVLVTYYNKKASAQAPKK